MGPFKKYYTSYQFDLYSKISSNGTKRVDVILTAVRYTHSLNIHTFDILYA